MGVPQMDQTIARLEMQNDLGRRAREIVGIKPFLPCMDALAQKEGLSRQNLRLGSMSRWKIGVLYLLYIETPFYEAFDLKQRSLSSFLDAFSNLYKRVCPSVRPSVGPSVRPSVGHTRVGF